MKKLGDLIRDELIGLKEGGADKLSDECREEVVNYIRDTTRIESEDISFICSLIRATNIILEADRGSLDGLLKKVYKINKIGMDRIKANEQMSWQEKFEWLSEGYERRWVPGDAAELERHYDYAVHERKLQGDYADHIFEILGRRTNVSLEETVLWADRKYDAHRQCADMAVKKDRVCATYQYALAANGAKAGFEIRLKQKETPLKEKLDVGEKWWEAHKLAADTAPVTEKKHAAYSRSFEGSAAEALFKFIDPMGEVSEEDKILWAERWYTGSKKGADMLVKFDNETAWCSYWSAKQAAEILWERKKDLSIRKDIYSILISLIIISKSYKRFVNTCRGAEFIAMDIYRKTQEISWREKADSIREIYKTTPPQGYENQKIHLPL